MPGTYHTWQLPEKLTQLFVKDPLGYTYYTHIYIYRDLPLLQGWLNYDHLSKIHYSTVLYSKVTTRLVVNCKNHNNKKKDMSQIFRTPEPSSVFQNCSTVLAFNKQGEVLDDFAIGLQVKKHGYLTLKSVHERWIWTVNPVQAVPLKRYTQMLNVWYKKPGFFPYQILDPQKGESGVFGGVGCWSLEREKY